MSYYFGFALGVLLVFLIVFVITMLMRRYGSGGWGMKSEYDERQKVAQGKAYQAGFWTLVVSGAAIFVVEMSGAVLPISYTIAHFLSLFLGIMVYVISCIFRDAYMGLNDNPKRWMLIDGAIAAVNLIISYTNFANGQNGWINLICALMLLVVMAAFLLKMYLNRSSDSDEGEMF